MIKIQAIGPVVYKTCLAVSAAVVLSCLDPRISAAAPETSPCLEDLQSIPDFLKANDPGVRDKLLKSAPRRFEADFERAQVEASAAHNDVDCSRALNDYLHGYRRGHLSVEEIGSPSDLAAGAVGKAGVSVTTERAPRLDFPSRDTALLTIPSFDEAYRLPLASLLDQRRRLLASHPNWIIDVRGNGGGSDSTYEPLLAWLLPSGYVETQAEWWVTAANIEGQERVCPIVAPGDLSCTTSMAEAVKRMRGAKLDTFVRQDEGPTVEYHRTAHMKARRPVRVAVLIDSGCASSCEQFLLAVRQGFSVKIVGWGSSAGSLDYSNLRPHELPSGKRRLWYATSRSMRLPFFPIDGMGVQPDIQVPIDGLLSKVRDADDETRATLRDAFMRDEVVRVQRWLESGAFDFDEDGNSR